MSATGVSATASTPDTAKDTVARIALTGLIDQECAIGQIVDMDFGDLNVRSAPKNQQVAFNCNVPFSMKLRATNGALALPAKAAGEGGYAGSVAYQLEVAIPLREPGERMLRRRFSGGDLLAAPSFSSDNGIATEGLTLSVALKQPEPGGLLAGNYQETIEITVTPLL